MAPAVSNSSRARALCLPGGIVSASPEIVRLYRCVELVMGHDSPAMWGDKNLVVAPAMRIQYIDKRTNTLTALWPGYAYEFRAEMADIDQADFHTDR